MKNLKQLFCFSIILFCITTTHAQTELDYLCGPDEDGCPAGYEEYCVCVPYNSQQYSKPYCLDFDKMTCEPLSKVNECSADFTYPDQGSCLATIFQSEPEPACRLVTRSFCAEHRVAVCDANGNPDSCMRNQVSVHEPY